MSMQRWIQRSIPLAAATLVGAAPSVMAQFTRQAPRSGSELFEWAGPVDREVKIVMRGNRVWTNNIGQTESGSARSRTISSLPRQDGEVAVQVLNGRGDVDVIQQPNSQNGYTTIVRIRDPRGGSDGYRIAAYYSGYANGDVYGNNRGNSRADERSRGQRGEEMRRRDEDDRKAEKERDKDERKAEKERDKEERKAQKDRDDRYGRNDRDNRDDRNNGGYNNRTVLRWSGNVDNEIEIRFQNGRVDTRTLSGAQPTGVRVSAGNGSNQQSDNLLRVSQNQGRGNVVVVQQPSSRNNYTTVIRIRDPQNGYGFYDFDLIW